MPYVEDFPTPEPATVTLPIGPEEAQKESDRLRVQWSHIVPPLHLSAAAMRGVELYEQGGDDLEIRHATESEAKTEELELPALSGRRVIGAIRRSRGTKAGKLRSPTVRAA